MAKPADIKTKQTTSSVADFLQGIDDPVKQADSRHLVALMEKASGEPPHIWGQSIIGFGQVRYKSAASGREVDWFKIGFSPRKNNLSLYLMNLEKHRDHLAKLGKYKTGVGCLYIQKLADVDSSVLEQILAESV